MYKGGKYEIIDDRSCLITDTKLSNTHLNESFDLPPPKTHLPTLITNHYYYQFD